MKKILTLTSLFTFLIFSTQLSASKDYTLKLKSGDVTLPANNPNATLSATANSISEKYVVVQFSEVPTNSEKEVLRQNGINLLEYLPLHAFIATITNASEVSLRSLKIRAIAPFTAKYKFSKAVKNAENPGWAVSGNEMDLMIEAHLDVTFSSLIAYFQSERFVILSENQTAEYIEVRIPKNKLNKLASSDIIKMIDYVPAPPETEDERGRTLHRSNMLDSDHPLGRKYDGTGVSIAIADDAVIGPHIDIKGRVTSFATNQNGSHGDMVSGIAMGAGNLNPDYRGMATGAYLYFYGINGYPHISNAVSNFNTRGVVITSTSYSEGCNGGYTSTTRFVDQQTRQNPELLHVFSAGNSSGSNCGYGASTGNVNWGTITGGRKQGKAVIATANLFYNSAITTSSSRGPATDGRIKPDISANGTNQMSINANNTYQVGGGTSAASPGIAGLAAQMYQGYKALNNGTNPESGLIKAAMLNTARDLGNVGPDFTYGWGRVDAHRAMSLIEQNRYLSSTISQNGNNSHSITVGANIENLKFMIYWTDYEALTTAAQALVNNMDLKVVSPTGDTLLPWVLNPAPNAAAITSPATKGIDNLNNMEQVQIDTVNAGVYTLLVNGKTIPQGPQKYFIVWETKDDAIEVTFPSGGEGFVPGTSETIRWDAFGNTGTTTVEYSLNNGATWIGITTTNGAARSFDWNVPGAATGDALVRVRKGSRTGVSANTFSIIRRPTNVRTNYICTDSLELTWNLAAGATGYKIYQLGATHMDSIGVTTSTTFKIYNLNLSDDNWFAVSSLGSGYEGKRSIASVIGKTVTNCPFDYDMEVLQIVSPNSAFLINCGSGKTGVTVTLRNNGDSVATNVPLRLVYNGTTYFDTLATFIAKYLPRNFTFSDSLVFAASGASSFSVITDLIGDQNPDNDSLGLDLTVLGTTFTLPYTEDFESNLNCATASNCGTTICNLNGGWFNGLNGVDDDFDLRVDFGGTPSNNTGPSIDHNPGTGTGRYLYSEASNGCTFSDAVTISPCFDLSNTIAPEFSFWYHMNGTSVGRINVDMFTNGSWTNNIITPINGSQGNAWQQATIDMRAYAGQAVNFRITVTTGNNWSSDIAIDDINFVDLSLGLNEGSLNNSFSVYPNPSDGMFTLKFKELPTNNIQITDMSGRIIEELNIKSELSTIDLSNYSKGIYFLTERNSGVVEKLIVY
ncbi:S8 family serine peptidase [Vicingaceae bacterium]|nr:S8 family serine peptidase [Vicingaceae bacterium]